MKFSGLIGFWNGDEQKVKGVYSSSIVEKKYVGEILKNYNQFNTTEFQNDDFIVSNNISILADLYARENFMSIKYVVWNGKALKVKRVEVNFPRLLLEIGGVYNGERPVKVT